MATTEVVKTIRSSGGDYTSLSAWEAGEQADLVTADEIAVAECYNDWPSGLDDALTIDGSTTDVSRYLMVRAADGEGHTGVPGTGVLIKKNANWNTNIYIKDPYCRIKGLELQHNASGKALYYYAEYCHAEEMILTSNDQGGSHTDYNQALFGIGVAGGYGVIRNSLIIGGPIGVAGYDWRYLNVENVTIVGSERGVFAHRNERLKNVVVYDCVYDSYYVKSGVDASSTNNAANDASTNTPPGSSPITTDIVSGDFTDAANDDYSLASGSTLIDAGADLSSDFTDDILGEARGATWDVGAFEYVAPATGPSLLMQGFAA